VKSHFFPKNSLTIIDILGASLSSCVFLFHFLLKVFRKMDVSWICGRDNLPL
jgi:hypothetical protein